MFKKRLLAYLIDNILLGAILALVMLIVPVSTNQINLANELETIEDKFVKEEITVEKYINQAIEINYQLAKEKAWYPIINIAFILIYFVIIPFYKDGATFGKRKCGIKVVSNDGNLTMNQLIIRNFIVNGLLQMLLTMVCLYILPSVSYFYAELILSLFQFILIVVTGAYMIKRSDSKGIQDILTNTKVVEVK